MNKLHLIGILAALLSAPSMTALAQEPAEAPAETEGDVDDAIADAIEEAPAEPAAEPAPAATPEPAATGDAAADAAGDADVDGLPEVDPESELYWSQMRDIYTYQPRAFLKERRFGISVYGGLIPNNIFEQYFPVGVRLNYFILENIGLELAGSYAFKSDTKLQPLIRESGGVGAQQILIGDTQVSHTNFGVVWSPFYGKTSFYDNVLTYFDLFLFAGAGLVVKETTPTFNAEPEREIAPEGALGAGIAFYFGNSVTLRADFRQFVFEKVAGVGGVANPSEVSIGVGYFF